MDRSPTNRYIFLDFNSLKKVKVKQLDLVCDKIYILVDSSYKSIPFKLVKRIQRLGKRVKWVAANTDGTNNVNYHIAFLMGKIHQKVDQDISFVVISEQDNIDPMIACVNDFGRTCLRVTDDQPKKEKIVTIPESQHSINADTDDKHFPFEEGNERDSLKDKTVKDTIRRLMNDKPPTTLDELRRYILRSNQEIAGHINIDDIIKEMIRLKEIKVDDQKVFYTFSPA